MGNPVVLCDPSRVSVTSLLDQPAYGYSEVDRLLGLRPTTARRWINGYSRGSKHYEPILRLAPTEDDWVTWGEFVEVRILSEYRADKDKATGTPTIWLREMVASLRAVFKVPYPLAHAAPWMQLTGRDPTIDSQVMQSGVFPAERDSLTPNVEVIRTRQRLMQESGVEKAYCSVSWRGESVAGIASQLVPDSRFGHVLVNPERLGGEPTFAGRRIPVTSVAARSLSGTPHARLANEYEISFDQIDNAIGYCQKHNIVAAA